MGIVVGWSQNHEYYFLATTPEIEGNCSHGHVAMKIGSKLKLKPVAKRNYGAQNDSVPRLNGRGS